MNFKQRLAFVNENGIAIVGFDIGNSGGLASNYPILPGMMFLDEMPDSPEKIYNKLHEAGPTEVTAENVHTMPGQGISSNGTLMKNKGILIGICAAENVKVNWIEPLKWIECFTLKRTKHFATKTKWKHHLLGIAAQMAPHLSDQLTLKTADAFLIWNYAASLHTPEPLKPIALK